MITGLKTVRDSRGFLVEYLNNKELEEIGAKFGMIYVASIAPGNCRGNHYHKNKAELICCVNGKVNVILFDVKKKEREEIVLDSSDEEIKRLLIEPGVAHLFQNNFDETAVLIAHSSEGAYNKDDDIRFELK